MTTARTDKGVGDTILMGPISGGEGGAVGFTTEVNKGAPHHDASP